jgi:hypothetical protein
MGDDAEPASPDEDLSEDSPLSTLYAAFAARDLGSARFAANAKIRSSNGAIDGAAAATLARALVNLTETGAPFTDPLLTGATFAMIGAGAARLCFSGSTDDLVLAAVPAQELAAVLSAWTGAQT